jgi:L-amino acid N-acyltransferase YncA
MPPYQIVPMQPTDWPTVREIYAQGIATRNATFETELPEWEKWDGSHRPDCRLVARDGSRSTLLGWAALSQVSTRRVYAGVTEVSVYVASQARGRGVGKALLQALVEQSEAVGIWTLQAGILPENNASLSLHKAFGFREVGIRKRIGKLDGVWRDVVLFERRSRNVGIS